MNGLKLSRTYYELYGRPMLKGRFSEIFPRMAVGLAGEGSECFGFDDQISQDHDFGPGFCIWLPAGVFNTYGAEIQRAYNELPKSCCGYTRSESRYGGGRVGTQSIEEFYYKHIGLHGIPSTGIQWMNVPEYHLAAVTNGEVFEDQSGEFSRIRNTLLAGYPQQVRLKKLAENLAAMAQSGQYNYPRCRRRGDSDAAFLARAEFVKAALKVLFLLNNRYMPFYKWAFRAASGLEKSFDVLDMLRLLARQGESNEYGQKSTELIELVCVKIIDALKSEKLTEATGNFLLSHAESVFSIISDPELIRLGLISI